MRILGIATALLLSTAMVPSIAQQEEKSSVPSQSQTTPVQPERTPQQSEQSRQQDQKSAEDTRVGRDWRAQQRDGERMGRMEQGRMEQERMGRMNDRDDWDHRTVGSNRQMQRDDGRGYKDGRDYYDEERSRVHIKICREYENGDEVCHYRN
jgi:hypothetical protein